MSQQAGFEFDKIFDQYLRGTDIPVLKYSFDGKELKYRLEKAVDGLEIPARVMINGRAFQISLTGLSSIFVLDEEVRTFELDRNFYIETQVEK